MLTDPERQEIEALKNGRDKLRADLLQELSDLEKKAQQSDPKFQPQQGDDINHLASRTEVVFRILSLAASQITDQKTRLEQLASLLQSIRRFGGPAVVLRLFSATQRTPEEIQQAKS